MGSLRSDPALPGDVSVAVGAPGAASCSLWCSVSCGGQSSKEYFGEKHDLIYWA